MHSLQRQKFNKQGMSAVMLLRQLTPVENFSPLKLKQGL